MRKLALVALSLASAVALGADWPVFLDGGSLVTSIDGGTTPVTVDLGVSVDWNMVIRCEGAQSTRYALCKAAPCACSSANQLLDSDRTFDIPVTQPGTDKYHYLSLCTDDGGTPSCKVQKTTPI